MAGSHISPYWQAGRTTPPTLLVVCATCEYRSDFWEREAAERAAASHSHPTTITEQR